MNRRVKPDVTDEAFASYEGVADIGEALPIHQTLVPKLVVQLEAIVRQREHLAKLLTNIENTSNSTPSAAL